jgi:hypothetical protein
VLYQNLEPHLDQYSNGSPAPLAKTTNLGRLNGGD